MRPIADRILECVCHLESDAEHFIQLRAGDVAKSLHACIDQLLDLLDLPLEAQQPALADLRYSLHEKVCEFDCLGEVAGIERAIDEICAALEEGEE